MKKIDLAAGMVLPLLFASSTAFADALPDYGKETVEVMAQRTQAEADIVIDVEKMKDTAAETVLELLARSAGVQVQLRANSGGNEDLTVKLRGHDSRHYAVYIDGVPMAMSGVMGGGYVDWSAVPLENIRRIEIIKGAKSAAYGGTLGGVIRIITKKEAIHGGQIKAGIGSNGRRQYSVQYHGTDGGNLGFSLYAKKNRQDAYLRNSDLRDDAYGLGLQYKLNATDQLKFSFDHNDEKRGVVIANIPGSGNYDSYYPVSLYTDGFASAKGTPGVGSYSDLYRNRWSVSWDSKRKSGSNQFTYWKNYEKRHEYQVSSTGAVAFDRYNITDQSDGFLLDSTRSWHGKHQLGFGADYRRLRYGYGWYDVNTVGASALYPSQKSDVYGLYLEDTWQLDRRWKGNIGLRYDGMKGDRDAAQATDVSSYHEAGISPKFNFSFKNNDSTTTSFSVHHIWRAPSMAEFYWHFASNHPWYTGNFAKTMPLEAEKGWGYEAAVRRVFSPKYQSKLTGFYQKMDSFINFTHVYPFNCYNIDDVKIWGIEWENIYAFDAHSQLVLNYTNQHTRKDGVDSRDSAGLNSSLDYRPRNMLSLGYTYHQPDWQLQYDVLYIGSQRASLGFPAVRSTQVVDLGGYVVHNLSFSKNFSGGQTLELAVLNLFDKKYSAVYGYPMEGRVYTMALTQKF